MAFGHAQADRECDSYGDGQHHEQQHDHLRVQSGDTPDVGPQLQRFTGLDLFWHGLIVPGIPSIGPRLATLDPADMNHLLGGVAQAQLSVVKHPVDDVVVAVDAVVDELGVALAATDE